MGKQTVPCGQPTPPLPPILDDARDLAVLPRDCELWPVNAPHSGAGTMHARSELVRTLMRADSHGNWQWPDAPVVFLSDTHADCDGFLRSLAAAGVIRRTGGGPREFVLTGFGRTARIVIGGDCLDKGPSNLDMLDALGALLETPARVHLLAGNHDLRLRLAIAALGRPRSVLTDHLFLRMGRKILPLLREVWVSHLRGGTGLSRVPDEAACRRRLVPGDAWFDAFPVQAAPFLSAASISREVKRLRRKLAEFDVEVAAAGLSMRQVLAATLQCETLFLDRGGRYGWFYDRMDAVCRIGSILFVHAGIDDEICLDLADGGDAAVNARYRQEAQRHPLAFYFGAVANLARTKYRPTDRRLTSEGVECLLRSGIKMIVHGHVNNHAGQRLLVRNGLLHLEGDITLDRASRRQEGLPGIGAGATLIFPSGDVVGLSSDYPRAKHFNPAGYLREADRA